MGSFSLGLPATAVAPGGDIVVAYYVGASTDVTDVNWIRVRTTAAN